MTLGRDAPGIYHLPELLSPEERAPIGCQDSRDDVVLPSVCYWVLPSPQPPTMVMDMWTILAVAHHFPLFFISTSNVLGETTPPLLLAQHLESRGIPMPASGWVLIG